MDLVEEARLRRWLRDPDTCRQIREEAGISRQRLADAVDVHVMTVYRWETNRRRPTGAASIRYARMLEQLATEIL